MPFTLASRALCTRERVLADGRRGTLRHVPADVAVDLAWRDCGLDALLAHELEEA